MEYPIFQAPFSMVQTQIETEQIRVQQLKRKKEKKPGRKPERIDCCPHTDLKHFAKGMCNYCYHRYGRDKFADRCEHTDRKDYAKGKCQNCYMTTYMMQKRNATDKEEIHSY